MLRIPEWGYGNLGSPGLGLDPGALITAIPGGSDALRYLRAEVDASARAAVKPYVMGAIAVSGVSLVVSLVALLRSFR